MILALANRGVVRGLRERGLAPDGSYQWVAAGPDDADVIIKQLNQRFAEGPRILAICLLVAALMAFPHARRGRPKLPIELVILGVSFGERAISIYLGDALAMGTYVGPALLFLAAVATLGWNFRGFWKRPASHPPRTVPT